MTTLVRFREPLRGLSSVNDEFERLMTSFFETPARGGARTNQAWVPALDVWETESDIVYAFDLPGIAEDKITVELEDGTLTVTGSRERTQSEERDRFFRYERRFGEFTRSIGLPQGVGEGDLSAHYANGVLEVHVRKPEQPKPHRIPVSTTIEGQTSEK